MALRLCPARATGCCVATQAPPVYDFLAPRFAHQLHHYKPIRSISTTSRAPSEFVDSSASNNSSSTRTKASKPLSQAQRDFLSSALRVNQAGELAATLIYTHQTPPIVRTHPHLRPLMKHMYDQEAGHLTTFNSLLAKHRIRPTALSPVWTALSSTLGWATGVMGREAAMACTEAVETEIGTHYNEQVRYLLDMTDEMKSKGEELGPDLQELVDNVRRIRDEELEHLDHAVDNDAKQAKPYELLTGVIRAGCRGAIWVSEKV